MKIPEEAPDATWYPRQAKLEIVTYERELLREEERTAVVGLVGFGLALMVSFAALYLHFPRQRSFILWVWRLYSSGYILIGIWGFFRWRGERLKWLETKLPEMIALEPEKGGEEVEKEKKTEKKKLSELPIEEQNRIIRSYFPQPSVEIKRLNAIFNEDPDLLSHDEYMIVVGARSIYPELLEKEKKKKQ